MNTYFLEIREVVGKQETVFTTSWKAESAEQFEKQLKESYDEKDWKKVTGYSIYLVNPIPEIVFYGMQ